MAIEKLARARSPPVLNAAPPQFDYRQRTKDNPGENLIEDSPPLQYAQGPPLG